MTQYLLAVHMVDGEPTPSDDEMQTIFKAVDEFNAEVQAAGKWVFAGGLMPADIATTVRHRGDAVVLTDGPFAESKEQLGGFWVIEASDLDEALEWATKGAVACRGDVEVRPFQDEPEA